MDLIYLNLFCIVLSSYLAGSVTGWPLVTLNLVAAAFNLVLVAARLSQGVA